MGPSSQAKEIQDLIHQNITGDLTFDGWSLQIPDEFLVNASASYTRYLPIASWLGGFAEGTVRIGNLYTDMAPSIGVRAGLLNGNGPWERSGGGILSQSKKTELYWKAGFGCTVVFFDGTAQGSLFQNDAYTITDRSPFYTTMTQGLFFRKNRITLGYNHVFNYGKVVQHRRHIYATLLVAYRFR